MKKAQRKHLLKRLGWTIFIFTCPDGTFYAGMTRDIIKELYKINVLKEGKYFKRNPEKSPVKIAYEERNVPFREAFAKYSYLKDMNRRQRLRLIKLNKWNASWRLYMRGFRSE